MHSLMRQTGYNYSFDPNACEQCGGNCCTGESGYIYLSHKEISDIAAFKGLAVENFKEEYLFKKGYKFSIKEKVVDGSHDCIFFNREIKGCGIYPVRPTQCRTFPFWSYFKTHQNELQEECPGVLFDREDDV